MAFGLVSLLVTIGVIAWIMHSVELPYTQSSVKAMQDTQQFTNQLSGVDDKGIIITDTVSLFADTRNDGKLQDLQVTQVLPNSPLLTKYGLKVNDVIVAVIDGHTVRTDLNGLNDEQAGRDAIRDAYSTGGQIVVQRGDDRLTLPLAAAPVAPQPMAQNNQSPKPAPAAQPPQQNPSNGNSNDTMDEIHQRLHALPTY
jgi:hypothetical protein